MKIFILFLLSARCIFAQKNEITYSVDIHINVGGEVMNQKLTGNGECFGEIQDPMELANMLKQRLTEYFHDASQHTPTTPHTDDSSQTPSATTVNPGSTTSQQTGPDVASPTRPSTVVDTTDLMHTSSYPGERKSTAGDLTSPITTGQVSSIFTSSTRPDATRSTAAQTTQRTPCTNGTTDSCQVRFGQTCFWYKMKLRNFDFTDAEEICARKKSVVANIYSKEHYEGLLRHIRSNVVTDGYVFRLWTAMVYYSRGNVTELSSGKRAPNGIPWRLDYPKKDQYSDRIALTISNASPGMINIRLNSKIQGVVCEFTGYELIPIESDEAEEEPDCDAIGTRWQLASANTSADVDNLADIAERLNRNRGWPINLLIASCNSTDSPCHYAILHVESDATTPATATIQALHCDVDVHYVMCKKREVDQQRLSFVEFPCDD